MKRGRPSRRPPLGQHFLADEKVRREVVQHLRPRPDDCWLEIGPGHGEITVLLAERVARIIAIEKDSSLAAKLQRSLSPEKLDIVHIVEEDILSVSLAELAKQHDVKKWRVFGSLPYYITSPILHRLFESVAIIEDIFVIVQKEVAERVTASPGRRDYAYLSVAAQFHTTPTLIRQIPAGCFRPPPQVDSALVALVPPGASATLSVADTNAFLDFVQGCFQHKRKTLLNNLTVRYPAERVTEALSRSGLDALSRGEEITLELFASLYNFLQARP